MSRVPVLGVVALFAALMLAGCTGGDDGETQTPPAGQIVKTDETDLGDKGAIAGLLVDDRFRPIELTDDPKTEFQANGFVLLQETGQQVKTTENGEFQFIGLAPGSYTLRVSAEGHEGQPQRLNVEAGKFAEATLVARRVSTSGGLILTEEFVGFVPCSTSTPAISTVGNCFDTSAESARSGPNVDYTAVEDISYLITEWLMDEADAWTFQFRVGDGSGGSGGDRYVTTGVENDRYAKAIIMYDEAGETVYNEEYNPTPWTNTEAQDMLFFWQGGQIPLPDVPTPTGGSVGGPTGLKLATRGDMVISIFIGEPDVDLEQYCILC